MLNLPTCLKNTWSYQKLGSGQAPLTVQVSLPDHVYWCRRNNFSDRQSSTIFLVISTMHKEQSSTWQEQIHLEGHCASSFSHISGHQSWFEHHLETWHFLLKIRCTSTSRKISVSGKVVRRDTRWWYLGHQQTSFLYSFLIHLEDFCLFCFLIFSSI